MDRFGKLWGWLGHISLAQWVFSTVGGGAMSGLAALDGQPLWLVVFVGFGGLAIALIVWPYVVRALGKSRKRRRWASLGEEILKNLADLQPDPDATSDLEITKRHAGYDSKFDSRVAVALAEIEHSGVPVDDKLKGRRVNAFCWRDLGEFLISEGVKDA